MAQNADEVRKIESTHQQRRALQQPWVFPYEGYTNEDTLAALIRNAGSLQGYTATCLIKSGAWGISSQVQLIQFDNQEFLHIGWSDQTDAPPSGFRTQLEIDLRTELANLRKEHPLLCCETPSDPDRGRWMTLFLAVGTDGDWLITQKPYGKDTWRDDAVDRIFRAVCLVPGNTKRYSFDELGLIECLK